MKLIQQELKFHVGHFPPITAHSFQRNQRIFGILGAHSCKQEGVVQMQKPQHIECRVDLTRDLPSTIRSSIT